MPLNKETKPLHLTHLSWLHVDAGWSEPSSPHFFTYSLSCALTFVLPKLLSGVATEWIGDISVNLYFYVPNFKFRWRLRSIEGKDVGVSVNKLIIFSYCHPFYLWHLFFFFRLSLISSMKQEDSSEFVTTPWDVLWVSFDFYIVEGGRF